MKQIIHTILLIVLLSMVGIECSAHDFVATNANGVPIYYKRISDTEVEVSYRGSDVSTFTNEYTGDVVVPKTVTYEGVTYSVTCIGAEAFMNCNVTSVSIPYGVTQIKGYAFYRCSALTSVTIPNSVTMINGYVFYGCRAMTSITIPNGVIYIGGSAFKSCSGLTSITIGNGVTYIDNNAFDGTAWYNNQADGLVYAGFVAYKYKGTMPGNTSVTLKDGTLGIADSAFRGCTGLTSVTIPNSVTIIGGNAFRDCSGLTSVTIPNGVTHIDGAAFYGCSGLTSVTIGNTVTNIGSAAFSGCSGLTSITIPNCVKRIYDRAFYGCSGLTSITIPNSVTNIGPHAFFGCSGLTSVTIGNSVTSIGVEAFSGCSSLNTIKVGSGNMKYDSRNNCNALIETETSILILGSNNATIPNGVIYIGDGAFYGYTGLTSITIPYCVTSIGSFAFENCTGLTSVTSLATNPPTCGYQTFQGINQSACRLKVPEASIDLYKAADQWKDFYNIEATAINAPTVDNGGVTYQYYDLNGQQLLQPCKGVNIVKSSDGKTSKVVVK